MKQKNVSRYPFFHVPHDGEDFPPDLMGSVCVPETDFLFYHGQMRDLYAGLLIPDPYGNESYACTFPVSRLLCDVERLIGPDEVMERLGMGFCYERVYDGTVIKRVTERLKAETKKFYDAHHRRMNGLCERHDRILLFDLHSYHDVIIPRDRILKGKPLPDLCLGVDVSHTPSALVECAYDRFRKAGLTVEVDYPYSGCYIPECLWQEGGVCGCDLAGVMLEFHRRAYLDAAGKPDFRKIGLIRDTIRLIMDDCSSC